ncbi:methyltransferase domain-containing protein [Natrarchaeobius sp. A-rgal3]|uniref:class I SAM-dependent methyltransferase n=1 Tax=Natrarchaeobius versutus TaxID=1679078 RepID=UPI00350F0592
MTMLSDSDLERIEEEIEEMYERRIEEKGTTPEGLYWDSAESMAIRFDAALDMYDFSGKRVLDVGCGFGDFYEHMCDTECEPAEYYGVDISESVLDVARGRFPDCEFERRNITRRPFDDRQFDIAVVFGALNHKLNIVDNEVYFRRVLRSCCASSDAVLVNALSRYREGDWPWEESVHYHSPEKAFGYAQELGRDVVLKHDFPPIPQKEFHLLFRTGTEDSGVTDRSGVAEIGSGDS